MHACLTVFPPDQAATVRVIPAGSVLDIGRNADCGLCIDHASVSRSHAQLRPGRAGWQLHDFGSKNGSFVDGQRVPPRQDYDLGHAGWLRFGDVYCEFALLDDAQAAAAASGRLAQRTAAVMHTSRIEGAQDLDALLDASLRGVLELAQCERGFVLLKRGGGFEVRASLALEASQLSAREFSGSVGAVRRALASGRSVVANDIVGEAWLSSRESVVAAGLSALVCVPLMDGGRALGAVYADRVLPAAAITKLDQELLEAFAERAALWIAARDATELLDAQPAAPGEDWEEIVAAHASSLP